MKMTQKEEKKKDKTVQYQKKEVKKRTKCQSDKKGVKKGNKNLKQLPSQLRVAITVSDE